MHPFPGRSLYRAGCQYAHAPSGAPFCAVIQYAPVRRRGGILLSDHADVGSWSGCSCSSLFTRNSFVFRLKVISKVTADMAIVMAIIKVRFARGSWKKIRSSQYSASQTKMEMGTAR